MARHYPEVRMDHMRHLRWILQITWWLIRMIPYFIVDYLAAGGGKIEYPQRPRLKERQWPSVPSQPPESKAEAAKKSEKAIRKMEKRNREKGR